MRYSSDEQDQGFVNYIKVKPARVLIDGVERSNVITADEDNRRALCTVLDEKGMMVVEDGRIKTEWITGTVVVLPLNH